MVRDVIKADGSIDLDHPFVRDWRKSQLEFKAKEQDSELICPHCNTNLPYSQMTIAKAPDGFDAYLRQMWKEQGYCTLCEKYFDMPAKKKQ